MVSQLTETHVEWTMPAPLWSQTGDPALAEDRRRFRTPMILRFATDSFMDDFLNLLNTAPERLMEFVAVPEKWDEPPNEPVRAVEKSGMALKLLQARAVAVRRLQARGSRVLGVKPAAGAVKPLKLYQPVHQRFYLVTTCLVCRVLGLPDRRIDAGARERATFILRMLQPHANADPHQPDPRDCDEFALVNGAWQALADPESFAAGEEQHPLSPAAYQENDARRRRLLVGLVPVGDRERLLQATQPNPAGQSPLPSLVDARLMLLKNRVIGPLNNLEILAKDAGKAIAEPAPPGLTASQLQQVQQTRDSIGQRTEDQLQQMSWYILLDLANYLETNLEELWQHIQSKEN